MAFFLPCLSETHVQNLQYFYDFDSWFKPALLLLVHDSFLPNLLSSSFIRCSTTETSNEIFQL